MEHLENGEKQTIILTYGPNDNTGDVKEELTDTRVMVRQRYSRTTSSLLFVSSPICRAWVIRYWSDTATSNWSTRLTIASARPSSFRNSSNWAKAWRLVRMLLLATWDITKSIADAASCEVFKILVAGEGGLILQRKAPIRRKRLQNKCKILYN